VCAGCWVHTPSLSGDKDNTLCLQDPHVSHQEGDDKDPSQFPEAKWQSGSWQDLVHDLPLWPLETSSCVNRKEQETNGMRNPAS
jgi:hypothetical protein